MEEQDYREYFDRIRLFNFMAKDIVGFAASKYGQEFLDYMDMNCGAMPEGEYEKVIDGSAPVPFLELYSGIVIKRLDLAAKKIMELGDGFQKVLFDYFSKEGENLGIKSPESIEEAYGLVRTCALDSMTSKDEFISSSDAGLCWKKIGNVPAVYWTVIVPSFLAGILKKSAFAFSVSDDLTFSLRKKS